MTCPLKAVGQLQKDYIGLAGPTRNSILPANWLGACVFGTICPSFLPLPLAKGESLEVPVYKDRGPTKKHRSLQIGDWKDDSGLLNAYPTLRASHKGRRWVLGLLS